MKKTITSSKADSLTISEYRKHIFLTDSIFGTIICGFALISYIIFSFESKVFLFTLTGYLIVSIILFINNSKGKYILAVYCNFISTIVLLTAPIYVYGNNLNMQLFLLSIGLNGFIYTNNLRFNNIFFMVHLACFAFISLWPITPVQILSPNTQSVVKSILLLLFVFVFLHKAILVFRLYIVSSNSTDKKNFVLSNPF